MAELVDVPALEAGALVACGFDSLYPYHLKYTVVEQLDGSPDYESGTF